MLYSFQLSKSIFGRMRSWARHRGLKSTSVAVRAEGELGVCCVTHSRKTLARAHRRSQFPPCLSMSAPTCVFPFSNCTESPALRCLRNTDYGRTCPLPLPLNPTHRDPLLHQLFGWRASHRPNQCTLVRRRCQSEPVRLREDIDIGGQLLRPTKLGKVRRGAVLPVIKPPRSPSSLPSSP